MMNGEQQVEAALRNYDDVDTWKTVIFLYNAALKEINTKLEILNDEFKHVHQYNPIEHIKTRIKAVSYTHLDVYKRQVFKAGETAELKIKVANKGNLDAQNVSIAPVVENTDDWPFDMEKLNYEQELGTIKAEDVAEAAWGSGDDKLKVREDVTGKSYKLVFRLTYDDGENQGCTDKYVDVYKRQVVSVCLSV